VPTEDGPPASRRGASDGSAWATDAALPRLEARLRDYPEDRALPPIEEIVAEADVPPSLLREDDRARKLIIEALLARPLSRVDVVSGLRTEVELLTLEVEVLTEKLRDPGWSGAGAAAAVERLEQVRGQLAAIRALL
jgi:hypothetical protein